MGHGRGMQVVRIFLAALAAMAGLTGAAMARETFEQRIAALMPHADIVKPDGPGPFPVVVQMHGCGGKKSFQSTWAEEVREAGWAAVVIDSFAHRRISRLEAYATVCSGARLRGAERAGDLFAALAWARRQSWADASRMVVAGWSHGGWAVLDALALRPEEAGAFTRLADLPTEPLEGVVGAFVVYPYCSFGCIARRRGLRWDAQPLALVGSRDVIVGGASLRATLEAMPAPRPVRVAWLEGATHAFDEPDAVDLRVRHDPALTAQAHALLHGYLDGFR